MWTLAIRWYLDLEFSKRLPVSLILISWSLLCTKEPMMFRAFVYIKSYISITWTRTSSMTRFVYFGAWCIYISSQSGHNGDITIPDHSLGRWVFVFGFYCRSVRATNNIKSFPHCDFANYHSVSGSDGAWGAEPLNWLIIEILMFWVIQPLLLHQKHNSGVS